MPFARPLELRPEPHALHPATRACRARQYLGPPRFRFDHDPLPTSFPRARRQAAARQTDLLLNPGDKIGLIGANGAAIQPVRAAARRAARRPGRPGLSGHLAHGARGPESSALDRPAIEYAIDGDATLRQLEAELAALEAEPESAENGLRMAEIYAALADADAYTAHSRAEQLLTGLGFTQEQMRLPLTSFSGGWRMRLNLAQALMCPSDLLLLDEPTNHLDLDAIIWLEDWLKRYPGTLLIISHDRDFLDEVVNVVVHIDERKLRRYSGNYSSFERQRAAQLVLAQGMMEKQMRQRALQSFIDRFKAQASKGAPGAEPHQGAGADGEVAPLRAAAEFSFEFREPLRAPRC